MATSFTFEDDKELVQLASVYVDAGTRVSWAGVARRMRRADHTAKTLQQRLRTLMKTWGKDIRQFPPSFFTPVHRPRGRPPEVTRQLRQGASTMHRPQHSQCPTAQPPVQQLRLGSFSPHLQQIQAPPEPNIPPASSASPAPPTVRTSPASESPSVLSEPLASRAPPPTQAPLAAPLLPAAQAHPEYPVSPVSQPPPVSQAPSASPVSTNVSSLSGGSSSVNSPRVSDEERSPPMSPDCGERAVSAIFAGVPRDVVVQGANKMPHRNAGELMPSAVSTLLREIGGLNESDIFLDIGAGVGNVIAQVALTTNVNKAIGIEVRRDLCNLGMKMMSKSVRSNRLLDRAQLVCQDIVDLCITTAPPYANTTVAYWNNLLFEPRVIEYVKEELYGMFMLRVLVSSLSFCPRHREGCHNEFCCAFKLEKVLDLPCSWKADLQQVFVYKSL